MNLTSLDPKNGLTRLMTEASLFPILSFEAEQELARRWRDDGDAQALQQLVGSHLRLVMKIARGYSGYGMALEDLVSQGNLGLMQAAEKFDPDRGYRFSTYALWWIRAAMQEYILHAWSIVKIGTTAAQKKLFFNLRRLKAEMRRLEEGDLPPEMVAKIAETLAVRESEVVEMNRRLSGADGSLNTPLGEEGGMEFQDSLVDEDQDPEGQVAEADQLAKRRDLLQQALAELSDREQQIVVQRTLSEEPKTLQDLAEVYDISRERVRQVESRAIEKLRKRVLNAAAAASMH